MKQMKTRSQTSFIVLLPCFQAYHTFWNFFQLLELVYHISIIFRRHISFIGGLIEIFDSFLSIILLLISEMLSWYSYLMPHCHISFVLHPHNYDEYHNGSTEWNSYYVDDLQTRLCSIIHLKIHLQARQHLTVERVIESDLHVGFDSSVSELGGICCIFDTGFYLFQGKNDRWGFILRYRKVM